MRKTFSLPVAATAAGGGVTPPPADTVDNIEHSVRFNRADSAHLTRTISGSSNTYTVSMWVKRHAISTSGVYQYLFSTDSCGLAWQDTDTLYIFNGSVVNSTAVFRDPSAWYHVCISVDNLSADVYVNGVEVMSNVTMLALQTAISFSRYYSGAPLQHHANQSLANIHVIDGYAKLPGDFTFTDSNGVLQPKAYTGSYGTNGAHLDFADTSSAAALGNDVSGNNNDFTPSGLVAGPAYTANSFSTEFDGTGDYLSIPNSSDFAFGTGDFTVEMWVYATGANGGLIASDQTGAGYWASLIYTDTLYWQSQNGSTNLFSTSYTNYKNKWTHVAFVRNSGTTSLYLNGTYITGAADSTNYNATGGNIDIGRDLDNTAYLNGKISNLRVIKGRALYTAAFTPPSTALTATDDTVLLTCQDATVRDNSNIGHSVTASGDVAVVNEGPFNGYSGSFDGTGDYIDNTSNYLISSTTSTFTVESWIYMTANPTNDSFNIPGLISVNSGGGSGTNNYMSFGPISSRKLRLRWYSGAENYAEGSTTLALNTWYHVACAVNSNSIKFFVNGVEETLTGTTTLTNRSGNENGFAIGQTYTYANYAGRVSNLRVTSGQALYTADFTPPTADLTTTSQGATASNVKLLTCQNSTFIDNSPSAHTITANGDAHPVSVNPHTDKYSVTFDGTGDYLTIPDSADWDFGTGDFTVEYWYNSSTTSGITEMMVETRAATYTGWGASFTTSGAAEFTVRNGSSAVMKVTDPSTSNDGDWHHFAATRSGTSLKLFIDGTQVDSDTNSYNISAVSPLYIGSNNNQTLDYNGKISNLRITKGQALYTSNFLPSKEDLTTTSQGATASNVKLLTCQSYKIQDNSDSAHTITVNGNAAPSTVAPFVTSGAGSFDGTGDYLSIPNSADFRLGSDDFTIEAWFNFNSFTGQPAIVGIWDNTNDQRSYLLYYYQGTLYFTTSTDGTTGGISTISSAQSLNTNQWYHVAVCRNSGAATLYLDGTSIATGTLSSAFYDNTTDNLGIGAFNVSHTPSGVVDGKISNVRISKGLARYTSNFTPPTEDFDPTDQDTTFLALQGNTLDDLSGNDHAVTANGDAATSTVSPFEPVDGSDAMLDSPTNYGSGDTVRGNYCTLNPIDLLGTGVTLSEGNLKFVTTASAVHRRCRGTIFVSSGKWYAEATLNTVGGTYPHFGIITNTSNNSDTFIGGDSKSYGYNSNGGKSNNGSATAYGATYTTGDTIGVALDLDAGTVVFYKNGVSQGTAYSSLSGLFTFGISGFGSSATWTLNFGQQPFKYPLAGYKSLCSTNLPTPAVADGSTAMDVALYTGTGTAQSISTPNLSPDLVWLKIRNTTGSHGLWDSVRGTSSRLVSNSTGAEDTTVGVTALSSNGFTVDGPYNTASNNWAAWTWDAGSSTVSNTDGTVTSQVRVNPTAGISIATFTGSGAGSFGHGLTKTPAFVITKKTAASGSWNIYHEATGVDKYLIFSTADAGLSTGIWSGTNSSVVGFSSNNNCSVGDNVAYCFAPVEGFSSFGSYVGDGSSSNGPFVYTGMRPKWIMIKDTTGSTNHWVIYDTERDTYNESGKRLAANLADQEGASGTLGSGIGGIDILSNGFKIDIAGGNHNTLNSTYIYAAFAEHPFKTSRAR